MDSRAGGFALMDALVALLLMGMLLAGVVSFASSQSRTYARQDVSLSLEENLRLGISGVTDALRIADYGVPADNLSSWIPWVSGFTSNPLISGSSPATLKVASCSPQVATLTSTAAAGATKLSLTSSVAGLAIADLFDTNSKSLILLDGSENARVKAVSGSQVTVDTNPTVSGNQGLSRSYPALTPLCRVDVRTFAISNDPLTGVPRLGMDLNQGAGAQSLAEGVTGLAITTVILGQQYQVTLTARSEIPDPATGNYINRSLSSNVTMDY